MTADDADAEAFWKLVSQTELMRFELPPNTSLNQYAAVFSQQFDKQIAPCMLTLITNPHIMAELEHTAVPTWPAPQSLIQML